ncbi:MAG: DUF3048 domain-containing protein [Acidimicrobiia bacterium]
MRLSGRRALVAVALVAAASAFASSADPPGGRRPAADAQSRPEVAAPVTTAATTTTTSTTTTTVPPTYPLTGRRAPDAEVLARAVVTLKIDNSAAARPQAGLEHADVVYEEFTEGITRLVALFHSSDADVAGPVRSVRPADADIATVAGGVLAFSGGSPAAVAVAAASPLTLVTEGDREAMYRRPGRPAPYNLYTSTAVLRTRAPAEAAQPPPPFAPFLPEGAAFSAPEATPAGSIELVPAPLLTASYAWDGESGTWRRSTDGAPHRLEGDAQLAPTTVIVQFAEYRTFEADAAVQYPEVVGSGEAWVFAGGMTARATWTKPSAGEPTVYTAVDGSPIVLPPGQTWVHLVAPDSPVSVG